MTPESDTISLLHDGRHVEAHLEVIHLPSGRVRLLVRSDGGVFEDESDDCFSTLQSLRRKLQKEGLDLFCYGSSRNVFPSAMSRAGRKAYRTFLGQQGRRDDLVDIFARGPDIELASVEDQEAFHRQWFDSLGKK